MRLRRLLTSPDVIIAAVLFVTSAAGAVVAHRRLIQNQDQHVIFSESLPGGSQSYAILGANGCIGTLSLRLDEAPDLNSLTLAGVLRVSRREQPVDLELSSEMNFTGLGQLSSGLVELRGQIVKVSLGLLDIDPIRVSLWASERDRVLYRHELKVPGPLQMEYVKGRLRLYYRAVAALPIPGAERLLTLLKAHVGIRLEPSSNPTTVCEGKQSRLNLDQVIANVAPALGPLGAGMPLP